jgi:hypothetical protein
VLSFGQRIASRSNQTLLECIGAWYEFAGDVATAVYLFGRYNEALRNENLTEAETVRAVASCTMAQDLFAHAISSTKRLRPGFGKSIAADARDLAKDYLQTMLDVLGSQARALFEDVPEREQRSLISRIERCDSQSVQLHQKAVKQFVRLGGDEHALPSFSNLHRTAQAAVATVNEEG